MRKIFIVLGLIVAQWSNAQTYQSHIQSVVDKVNAESIYTNLENFVSFGEKRDGSLAHEKARKWLLGLYQEMGYSDIELHAFTLNGKTTYNIIVTKKGTKYPDEYIIVDGHYDTINGPGANDNGSGTTALLEIARLLKDVETEYSIKFIHFTAEEIGLLGSKAYVEQKVIPENINIKLVFNIDEIGGVNGKVNNKVICEYDNSSPQHNNQASRVVTQQMANIFGLYTSLATEQSYAYSSDYMPFQNAGFVITGLFEGNYSPYPHTSRDTIANLDKDYLVQVIKGAVASTMHFAGASASMGVADYTENLLVLTPNPTQNTVKWNKHIKAKAYELYNIEGQLQSKGITNTNELSLQNLEKGIYQLVLMTEKGRFTAKLIKE